MRQRLRRLRRQAPFLEVVVGIVAAVVVTAVAVRVARAWDLDPVGQRIVAFGVVATALVVIALATKVKEGEPFSVAATFIGIAASVIAALSYIGPIEKEAPLGCINSDGHLDATVSSTVAQIYEAATPASNVKALLVRGCRIHPVGFCIGPAYADTLEPDVLDSRWLILPKKQGLVFGGRTAGTIPPDEQPQTCPRGLPPPKAVRFRQAVLDPRRRVIKLSAQTSHAAFIGFAIEYQRDHWRRIGWDNGPSNTVDLHAPAPPGSSSGKTVIAVACFGFGHPSRASARVQLTRGRSRAADVPREDPQPTDPNPGLAACNSGVKANAR